MPRSRSSNASEAIDRLLQARHHDPFEVLGKHREGKFEVVRAYIPDAQSACIEQTLPMSRQAGTELFEWRGAPGKIPDRYRITWRADAETEHTAYDPYCFPPQIAEFDLHLFGEGRHLRAFEFLGAHAHTTDSVSGVLFATWAPNAERVSVVGDFNQWDGRRHPMRVRGGGGVWELFVPGLTTGMRYKLEIRSRRTSEVFLKSDPYGRCFEMRPDTASLVPSPSEHEWADAAWIEARARSDWLHEPLSIYEAHAGSWQRGPEVGDSAGFLNYRELAHRLVDYLRPLGFTHVELLPLTEHPLDASWGYQTTGYYAPTSRYGSPDDFRYFVDYCHSNGIGVLMDWAPAHFPRDAHALARFDGTTLYEHGDPRRGEHRDWGTLIFDYGRNEVRNFLLSNAIYWLEEFHIDGLRVDAVASMLYLDYSREPDDWLPNQHGGNENLEAIEFFRDLNEFTHREHPGTLIIAEESTSWPQVTRPTWLGGLGFSMKWNMGWMNDTLAYFSQDPVHRSYHHSQLTFGLLYSFTENFVLPLSHDEVVHGKGSLLAKMPGDAWQRMANLRLLYTYMWTYPGKKLLFMGGELGQASEWNHAQELDWTLLNRAPNLSLRSLLGDLNHLYVQHRALHAYDFEGRGFQWIDCHDSDHSVISYLRVADEQALVVVLNFTPVPRQGYRLGVPRSGWYAEILNSDSHWYGGSDVGNGGGLLAEAGAWMGQPYSLTVTLPPLGGLIFRADDLSE